jgi:hypothetical protein
MLRLERRFSRSQAQHGKRDAAGFGTGQANYADTAASGRRGNGDDGVVEIHISILCAKCVTGW